MEAYDYFQSYESYFWQWEEQGNVIAIPGGNTIAYKEYIIDVLEKLADQGVPPIGSLLLAILATNPNAEENFQQVYTLLDKKVATDSSTREPLDSAMFFLRYLSALPAKYKEGKNKLLLLQTLFSDCHNIKSAAKAKDILDIYRSGRLRNERLFALAPYHYNVYFKDFRTIGLLSKKFADGKQIIEALGDVPTVTEEIPLETTDGRDAIEKDFIQELIDHEKTFHVASLVKSLWSGLNIPYHNLLPGQQPLGGVSDLTNKGEFHRLLISEFANEDLVFLSRLSNNEALYLNREKPPHDNDRDRVILIDASVKNWGTPKLIAYALLIAIAKHPKTNLHCSAFAIGTTYHPLSFNTVDEVINCLQVLEPCLHPVEGLEAFFREYGRVHNMEVFFITSREAYRQPVLQKAISDHYASFNYWIQTDETGNIDLYKRQQSSRKHVQHICLPLEEKWKKEAKAGAAIVIESDIPYPILFPGAQNPRKILVTANEDIFQITKEGNLMRLYDTSNSQGKGWQLMYENLGFKNGEAAIGVLHNGQYVLLIFTVSDRQLTMINLHTRLRKSMEFAQWGGGGETKFIFSNDRFYYANKNYARNFCSFLLGEENIIVQGYPDIPFDLMGKGNEDAKTPNIYKSLQNLITTSIFKNVTSVFINNANNLVFNLHELALKNGQHITLSKTKLLTKNHEAIQAVDSRFTFPDGSTVAINRSGMLILRSSNASIRTIYIPSVLNASLGVASDNAFAGNEYYLKPDESEQDFISPKKFWKEYIDPFIANIRKYEAQN